MLNRYHLVLDTFCEMAAQLEPYADQTFWDWSKHSPVPNSVTVVSRQTLNTNYVEIKSLAEQSFFLPVLVNPTEGSETMKYQCARLGLLDLMAQGKFLTVGCGDMEPQYANLWYDSYLYKPYDYDENVAECERAQSIFTKLDKPYQFLFLNGRSRAHRKYVIEQLRDHGLLTHALWTNLDRSPVPAHTNFYGDWCNRPSEIQLLPPQYEVTQFKHEPHRHFEHSFVKNELFGGVWGEIYLQADAYIDTYFSVVTETVFEYPYSLRSEKIYKPIAIGHPFVAAASRGFYRDLHQAGFRTFGHLIDESFDLIDNGRDRLDRLVSVVADLCQQDLAAFVVAAQEVCVYNQQHMRVLAPKIKAEFVPRFQSFITQHLQKLC